MKRINWSILKSNIPNKLKVASKVFFEILWSSDLVDSKGQMLYGLTRFEPDQIVISKNQSDKEAVLTLFHEGLHALSDAHEINLTENQVRKLEKCYPYIREIILKLEGIIK